MTQEGDTTVSEWEWYYKTKNGAFYARRFARQRSSDTTDIMVVMDQGTDCLWVCTLSSLEGYLDSYKDIVAVYRDGYTLFIDGEML